METTLQTILEQQQKIIQQQQEILRTVRKFEEIADYLKFATQRQFDEINSRLEINERSTRQIDQQLALLNIKRQNELPDLKATLERLQALEEFLRLDISTRLLDSLER